ALACHLRATGIIEVDDWLAVPLQRERGKMLTNLRDIECHEKLSSAMAACAATANTCLNCSARQKSRSSIQNSRSEGAAPNPGSLPQMLREESQHPLLVFGWMSRQCARMAA